MFMGALAGALLVINVDLAVPLAVAAVLMATTAAGASACRPTTPTGRSRQEKERKLPDSVVACASAADVAHVAGPVQRATVNG